MAVLPGNHHQKIIPTQTPALISKPCHTGTRLVPNT